MKKYTLKLKGTEVTLDFSPDDKIFPFEEIHLDPLKYGVLDLVQKKQGVPAGEVVTKNGIFSFIKYPQQEPYIVDCRDFKRICFLSDVQELKLSASV